MVLEIQLTVKFIEQLCGVGRTTAEKQFKAIVKFCNNGDDYEPCIPDFCQFHNWSETKVLAYHTLTREEIIALYKEELKNDKQTITINAKYAGKATLVLPAEIEPEVEIKEVFNKLEITPDGKLEAREKKIVIKVKKKK